MKDDLMNRSWDYLHLVDDVIARIDLDEFKESGNDTDFIWEAIDSEIVYYRQQWIILEEHFLPTDLNEDSFNEAMTLFFDDVMEEITEVLKEKTTDSIKTRKPLKIRKK